MLLFTASGLPMLAVSMQHDKMRLVSAGTPLVIGRSGCGVGAAGGDEDEKVGMLVGMKTKRWGCWWG